MAAAKGNQYWKFRNKHGRNFKYTPEEFEKEGEKYFEYMEGKSWIKKEPIKSGDLAGTLMDVPISSPMSLESFCLFADIDFSTFYDYEKGEGNYKDFSPIATRIRAVIESDQLEGSVVGIYNPSIIARKLGLADKKEVVNKTDIMNEDEINDRIEKLKNKLNE